MMSLLWSSKRALNILTEFASTSASTTSPGRKLPFWHNSLREKSPSDRLFYSISIARECHRVRSTVSKKSKIKADFKLKSKDKGDFKLKSRVKLKYYSLDRDRGCQWYERLWSDTPLYPCFIALLTILRLSLLASTRFPSIENSWLEP